MDEKSYKYIVVGKGMIGSAAARHLSRSSDGVMLIGPDEPLKRADHDGVFASHYDEGRFARILDDDLVWATIAKRSVERYRDIETASGVCFFHEVGYLYITNSNEQINQRDVIGIKLEAGHERLSNEDLIRRYPYLAIGDNAKALCQPEQAGHISPRNMVKAQMAVAEKQGSRIVNSVVHSVSSRNGGVEVTTAEGITFLAEKVLVATGGFANTLDLLPRKLDVTVFGRTIVLARLEQRQLEVLEGMPSVGYIREDGLGGYILPPIKYPDGSYYVKMGRGRDSDPSFSDLDDLKKWFKSKGDAEEAGSIWNVLKSFIPSLEESPIHTDTCIVTQTRTGYPYIDMTGDSNIGVAVGGNGKAAKSSDEWGRIAALMLSENEWSYDIPAETFKACFQNS